MQPRRKLDRSRNGRPVVIEVIVEDVGIVQPELGAIIIAQPEGVIPIRRQFEISAEFHAHVVRERERRQVKAAQLFVRVGLQRIEVRHPGPVSAEEISIHRTRRSSCRYPPESARCHMDGARWRSDAAPPATHRASA